MGLFERFLNGLGRAGHSRGVALGPVAPGGFQAIAALEIAHVNLVVAVFIWIMIYPMMIQIDWHAVKDVGRRPRGLVLTLVVNRLIKPFTMAALGVLFFHYIFAPWVDPQSASGYIAGMILLGVAPCTAMVFVWSQLVRGDANYRSAQGVGEPDLIMVVAFAPIAAFPARRDRHQRAVGDAGAVDGALRGLAAGCGHDDPVGAGASLYACGGRFRRPPQPWSIIGLIATVVLLVRFPGGTIVERPLVIAMIAVPLICRPMAFS